MRIHVYKSNTPSRIHSIFHINLLKLRNKNRPGERGTLCGFRPNVTPFGFDAAPSGMARASGQLAAFANYKDLHPSLSLSHPFNLSSTSLCSVSRPGGLRPIFPATITDRPITFRLSLACKRYRIASPPLRPRAPPHLATLMHDLSQPQSAPPLIKHTRPPRRCSTSARTKLIPFWGAPKASIR